MILIYAIQKNVFRNKGSVSVIDRMFSTAMGVFILTSLISVIGPTIDGIIVGPYYSVDEVAAIGLTSYLLVGFRTLAASIIEAALCPLRCLCP